MLGRVRVIFFEVRFYLGFGLGGVVDWIGFMSGDKVVKGSEKRLWF